MKTLVDSGFLLTPWPFLEVGQKVLVEKGPLAGVEGIVQATRGRYRLVVSISLLQRAVATEIDRMWVRPLSTPVRTSGPDGAAQHVVIESKIRLGK